MTLKRLHEAGLVDTPHLEGLTHEGVTFDDVRRELIDGGILSLEELLRAKKAYEYDLLFSLGTVQRGNSHYVQDLKDVDDSLSINLSVTQFLLDLVEYPELLKRYEASLSPFTSADIFINKVAGISYGGAEIGIFYDTLIDSELLSDLIERSLLSKRDFIEKLLQLLDDNAVVLSEEDSSKEKRLEAASTAAKIQFKRKSEVTPKLQVNNEESKHDLFAIDREKCKQTVDKERFIVNTTFLIIAGLFLCNSLYSVILAVCHR